ncbi:hypothetical protein S7711_02599 [Stachybotrys chartarum IBT 7711]|uniref:ATPase AAA-type core domain-containing protein n=1 Tax=Stachybotrys chartarum (strain CBS 109288 / IBT 7711) TaxID=1280523 RepID=A0A084B8X7_STACB|nr:hypothetical protein S7711_02599 [Stachybotrys chartarum IBT 7711]KFA56255.1 hypothetical protein S40293_00215 [Stachybotrys chartarum IBT 40293]
MGSDSDQLSSAMAAVDLSTKGETDAAKRAFFDHSTAKRVNTDAIIVEKLTNQYPSLELVVAPTMTIDLFGFANAGNASLEPLEDTSTKLPGSFKWDFYFPPLQRIDGDLGRIVEQPKFASYICRWSGNDFIIYYVEGRDGAESFGVSNYYILTTDKAKARRLILEAGNWSTELHDEVWVFDQGYWQKSAALFQSFIKASWDVVILEPKMKDAIIEDHLSFFRSRDTYERLRVPWKRGIIYHGPPGNGKTISIKATMKMLYQLDPTVLSLYVRSLQSWGGDEYSIKAIFSHARRFAPCYLIFEDLDSLIGPGARSYFLNEVDGLTNNDGIFMIGSTNHLDQLDPGISKRPSRFDRKYYFPDPNLKERILYCQFWQRKLSVNKEIEFPDELCKAIAEITDKFSFAYIQEAFIATLLAIARKNEDSADDAVDSDLHDEWVDVPARPAARDLDKLPLWVEIKKQVAVLRESLDDE